MSDGGDERLRISSGAPWEAEVGYSRAVRVGAIVEVAGTTAVDERGEPLAVGDPAGQTRIILERIAAALAAAGATMADVVRTRIYVTDITQWSAIGAAHGERFAAIRPAATMVEVQRLIHPDLLVEIEATAIVGDTAS
ncbi:MAG: RidA family protein [Myxococcales bacterium]|nr:RidA family protein [Myxococcales bacterium]MCB9704622.1 RidA family protein [Myxococcales bacterium]